MKRDMELIRKILLAVQDGQPNKPIEGFTNDEVNYHRALVIDAGFIEGAVLKGNKEIPVSVNLNKLTWAGHDFIDAIASESNWQQVKDFLKDAGKQITIETVKVAVSQIFGFGTT